MKNYLAINAGKVILTKYNALTGALSSDPKDKRILTETCEKITRSKATNTYELANGNSDSPAGIYELGVAYNVGIVLTTLSSETLAFLQNTVLTKASGNMKQLVETCVPTESPYELTALGNIVGNPTILDSENKAFELVTTTPGINQFKVTAGSSGTKQSMTKNVTAKASTAGTAKITITAAGSRILSVGKELTVNLTTVDVNTNASEIRSVLKNDIDIIEYFDVGGTNADVVLTRKFAAETESEAFNFVLGTALGATMGATVPVAGVASVASKLTFNSNDAGKPINLEYVYEAGEVESYSINKNAVIPAVQIEIIHETLSRDKTKRYKNNSIISRAQLNGNLDENLARQHEATTLNFVGVEPIGVEIVKNKRSEIPL